MYVYINAGKMFSLSCLHCKTGFLKGIKGSFVFHTPSLKTCTLFRAIRPLLSAEPQVPGIPLGVLFIEAKRGPVNIVLQMYCTATVSIKIHFETWKQITFHRSVNN